MREDIIETMAMLIEEEFNGSSRIDEIKTYDDFIDWTDDIRDDITTSDSWDVFADEDTRDELVGLIKEYGLDVNTICHLLEDERTASAYVCDYLFNDARWVAWIRVEPDTNEEGE